MKNKIVVSSLCVAATLLSACTAPPKPYHYRPEIAYADALPPTVVAPSPPPARHAEVMGEPPVRGYLWIAGTWLWENGQYNWREGRWMAPRPGYAWKPHRWHQEGYEWHMDDGYWLRMDKK